jgi:hypothetical protein
VVVHIVGEADLGIASNAAPVPAGGERGSFEERAATRQARLGALATRPSGPESRRLLAELDWRDGRPVSGTPGADGAHRSPLATILSRHAHEVALLLIATELPPGQGRPELNTADIADALGCALAADPALYGAPVRLCSTLRVTSVDEAELLPQLRGALDRVGVVDAAADPTAAPTAVELVWGAGMTTLAIAALAALIERRSDWRAVEPDQGTELPLHLQPGPDPRLAWYLRLGYPHALLDEPDVGLPAAAEAIVRAVIGRLNVAPGIDPTHALAQLVAADLRRQDSTAALAVRALVVALYRARLGAGERDWFDLHPGEPYPTLGTVIGAVRAERPPRSAADKFLLSCAAVNGAVSDRAHRLRALSPAGRGHIRALLERVDDPAVAPAAFAAADLPDLPRVPTGEVLAVWAVGHGRPYGQDLVANGPGAEVSGYVDAAPGAALSLRIVLVPTIQTAAAAEDLQRLLEETTRHGSIRDVTVAVTRPVDKTAPAARAELLETLAQHGQSAEALVLAPIGDKDLVAGLLHALLDHSARRGIPIFLRHTHQGLVGYQQLGGLLGNDRQLVPVVRRALVRLDLDTAARLLGAGSRQFVALAAPVTQLSNAVRGDARPGHGWPPGPAGVGPGSQLVAARTRLVADVLADHVRVLSAADQTRLLHLAWQLVEVSFPGHRVFGGLPPGGAEVNFLRRFRDLRDALPTTHGQPAEGESLHNLLQNTLPRRWNGNWTPARAAERLADVCGSITAPGWPHPATPDGRLTKLHRTLLNNPLLSAPAH